MLSEFVQDDEELLELIEEKIRLFKKKPTDTRLKNHPLKRRLKGRWAFSVTGDIRIVYRRQGKNRVRFLIIGDHTKVYSKQ